MLGWMSGSKQYEFQKTSEQIILWKTYNQRKTLKTYYDNKQRLQEMKRNKLFTNLL